LRFLQGLIAIGSIIAGFYFLIAFASPGEIGNEIPSACYDAVSEI
jgi:hypothetical protein